MSLQGISSVTTGIIANLLVQATGTLISANSLYNVVNTCTGANGAVTLPAIPALNQRYTIKNQGIANCLIYPNGTAVTVNPAVANASIDALAINIAYILAPNSAVELICSGNIAGGSLGLQWYSMSLMGSAPVVACVVSATPFALPPSISGTVYSVTNTAGGTAVVTLPAPTTSGLRYDFICGSATMGAITRLDAGVGLLDGVCEIVNGTPVTVPIAGATNRFVNFLVASAIGDRVSLVSDGTHWKAFGLSSVIGLSFS